MPVLSQDLLKLIADKSSMSFQAYAEAIAFQPIEKLDPDPLFQEAVIEEFATLGYTDKAAQGFLQHKTLQTSHHLTPTLGPSFLGGDCLALVSSTTPYYVGAYTAVPLNNSAWSGSLSFLETELFTIVQPDSHYYRVLKKISKQVWTKALKKKKFI